MRNLGVGGLGIKDLLTYAMEMKALMTPTIAPDHASKSSKQHSHHECLNLRLFQAPHQVSHFKTGWHGNPQLRTQSQTKGLCPRCAWPRATGWIDDPKTESSGYGRFS